MAALAALLGTACQRELTAEPAAGAAPQENLTPRIAAFVALAEHAASSNGHNRDAATYTTDSAAWYVEGALNYSLAQPWLPYNEFVNDSLTVTIASNSGAVAVADAANAYVVINGQLQQALTGGDRHLVVLDARPNATANGLELKIHYTMGQGHERLALNTSFPANTSLYFLTYGSSSSSCDPNTYSAKGADKRIQDRVSVTIPLLAVGQYYASVESWSIVPWGPPAGANTSTSEYGLEYFFNPTNTSGHSNQNHLVYYCDGPNCGPCLDASDMSFHTQGTYNAMGIIRTEQCPTKVAASISVVGNLGVGAGGGPFHEVHLTYGKVMSRKM